MITIGMATFDDFEGVFYSVQALRMFHADAMSEVDEIIVVDNNPESVQGQATKAFVEGACRGIGRYVPFTDRRGSCPPRGHLFDVAKSDVVLCIDSHVFLTPGSLQNLIDWFKANPKSNDLVHGPLISNTNFDRIEGTHMVPQWRSEMFGTWGVDERGKDPGGEPFDIPQHGLGLFAMRREAWPKFNPRFDGFSGGEGYIHHKTRQRGGRVLCHPGVRWLHKFTRPEGVPHRPRLVDKIKNHLIGWAELGLNLQPIVDHFVGGIGTRDGKQRISATRLQGLVDECGIDFKVTAPKRATKASGVIVGPTSFGSYQMRGRPLATKFSLPEHNSRGRVELHSDFDVGIAVKADPPPVMRERCSRLIWDCLDAWFVCSKQMRMKPDEWFRMKFKTLKFDDIIATSPAIAEVMSKALPGVAVHLVEHQADHRIEGDWYDPSGPIVYAGGRVFVDSAKPKIEAAAAKVGKKVIFDHDHNAWRSLKGASLVLSLRLPPYNTELNRLGKPQVKVANAAAAGIPVLSTDCPATLSIWPEVVSGCVNDFDDEAIIASLMRKALASAPPKRTFPVDDWIAKMKKVIG